MLSTKMTDEQCIGPRREILQTWAIWLILVSLFNLVGSWTLICYELLRLWIFCVTLMPRLTAEIGRSTPRCTWQLLWGIWLSPHSSSLAVPNYTPSRSAYVSTACLISLFHSKLNARMALLLGGTFMGLLKLSLRQPLSKATVAILCNNSPKFTSFHYLHLCEPFLRDFATLLDFHMRFICRAIHHCTLPA